MASSGSTLPDAIAKKLETLKEGAQHWHEMPDDARAKVARDCRAQLATLDMDWVEDNLRCLGIEPSYPDAGKTLGFDPFLFLATVAGRLDKVAESLEGTLKSYGESPNRQLPNGPVVYDMGPVGQAVPGCNLELWSDPNAGETSPSSASTAGVGVVLGAGNQNFLTAVDVIQICFCEKKCVFLKHHPLRHFMAKTFEHIFKPLADIGAYAQCVNADLEGAHAALVCSGDVKHIHMTGSGLTHDRVLSALKADGRETDVLFTSELGCVTPWIVCPGTKNEGKWTDKAISDQAKMLTSAFKSSCSMNCLSPKVLVIPPEELWPQRKQFLDALRKELATMPQPPPYYPGAHQRFEAFQKEYPDAEVIDAPPVQKPGRSLQDACYPELGQNIKQLPSLLFDVGTIGDSNCRTYGLQNEAFAPVLAIATVSCEKLEDFPLAAAHAVNEHVFGNLSCNLIYPDAKDEVLDVVLNTLNYGTVSVNFWAALTYSNPLGVWGGAPGSYKPAEPNSGLGFVGNAANIQSPCKCIGYSAFENKNVVMGKPMPYIMSDILQVVISGRRFAGMRILGVLLRRMFGILPRPMPSGACI